MQHRILVVDDDVVDRQIAKRALKSAGVESEIVEVSNGEDAVAAVQKQEFDCILLDFRLPGINGFDVLRNLKPHVEVYATPVIMMTSYQDEAQAVEAINHGASNFIQKDQITPNVLSRAVTSAIELKALKSERRAAEMALRQKQALLESAQELAALGGWQYYMDTGTSIWSDGIYRLVGIEPGSVKPGFDTMERFFDMGELERYRETCNYALTTKRRHHIRQSVRTVHGDLRSISHIINPVTDGDGNVVQLTGIIQDITDRLKIEEALEHAQRMDSLGQLSGGIAHDFNNLLGILVGHLGLLKRAVEGEEALEKRVETLMGVTDRGTKLVQRLLQFSRKEKADTEVIDVNSSITDLREMLSKFLTSKIDIQVDFQDDVWAVLADRGELDDAIVNLSVNARDAMPDGGKLTISTRNVHVNGSRKPSEAHLHPSDYVVVSVSDTGTGMPQEVIDRAVEPFFTTKERGKGTGLGLSMVYGFAKRNCGSVIIDSIEGEGATIHIYLPRHKPVVVASGQPDPDNPTQHVVTAGLSVLIVDDEEDLGEIAADMLSGVGYRVHRASSVRQAIQILDQGTQVDVVFSDVIMPGGSTGFDLARELNAKWPTVKILLTSGYTGDSLPSSLDPNLIRNILRKPYKLTDLVAGIRNAVPAVELSFEGEGNEDAHETTQHSKSVRKLMRA